MKCIKYQIMTEVNHGTDDDPNIVQTIHDCIIQCSDETFESNYAIAQKEAYGEITVEDIPDPVTPPSLEDRIASLEAENAQLKASNAALEDAICELDVMLCGGAE